MPQRPLSKRAVPFALSALAAALLLPHAHAQEAAPELETVTVAAATTEDPTAPLQGYVAHAETTATKTSTPIIESPQSVSVVTRDQMDAQNAQSVSDALRYSAGVMAEANGPDPRADVITIRGFDSGMRSSFRDGLRQYAFNGQGGVLIETYGLERIEVLRGPSSVLYGQGGAGGTVNLVSKRPTATDLREVQLQYGSHDRLQGAFDVSGVASEGGNWLYRLTGLVRDADTQIDHVTDNRIFIAPAATWLVSDVTTMTFLADYQKNERGQGYQALPRQGTLDYNPNGKIPVSRFVGDPAFDRFDQERYSLGYAFEHRFSDNGSFRQNARYLDQVTDANSIYQAGLDQTDFRTITRYGSAGREAVQNAVIDNQLEFKLGGAALQQTLLVGFDYQWLQGQSGSSFGVVPDLDVFNPVYGQPLGLSANAPVDDTDQSLTQAGFYLQDQIKLQEKIAITLGGRYDTTESETTDIPNASTTSQKDKAFTGRAGVVYLADNGLAPYAGYSNSFSPAIGTDYYSQPFEPETGQQLEIGLRYQPLQQNSSWTVSLFDLRRQNVLTEDLAHAGESVQTGEVRARGIELEGKASLQNGLDLVAGYTFNNVEVTQTNTATQLGKTPSATPEQIASLWLSYAVPRSQGLTVSAGARYIGKTWGDEEEQIEVPAYTLLDAAFKYDLAQLLPGVGKLSVALNFSNLLNKEYVATCGYYADGCRYGYLRTVAGTVNYRW